MWTGLTGVCTSIMQNRGEKIMTNCHRKTENSTYDIYS